MLLASSVTLTRYRLISSMDSANKPILFLYTFRCPKFVIPLIKVADSYNKFHTPTKESYLKSYQHDNTLQVPLFDPTSSHVFYYRYKTAYFVLPTLLCSRNGNYHLLLINIAFTILKFLLCRYERL